MSDDEARPCEVCGIGWQDEQGVCDEPGCEGAGGGRPRRDAT